MIGEPGEGEEYILLNLDEAVRALVETGHHASRQEQLAALGRRGIYLARVRE